MTRLPRRKPRRRAAQRRIASSKTPFGAHLRLVTFPPTDLVPSTLRYGGDDRRRQESTALVDVDSGSTIKVRTEHARTDCLQRVERLRTRMPEDVVQPARDYGDPRMHRSEERRRARVGTPVMADFEDVGAQVRRAMGQ